MPASQERPRPRENHLLAHLPAEDFRRLRPLLRLVRLQRKQVLEEPGEPVTHAYFPLNSVCSAISLMADGSTVEVDTVGRDGLVGLARFFGAETTPFRVFAQIPGEALRLPAEAFAEAVERPGALRDLVHRYAQARYIQTAQLAACNRLHQVEQRCARWLLLARDRVGADRFPLTQEFFAQILGVRRSSVTVAAGALQQAGSIRYAYGLITVVDRAGLEAVTCECYRVIAGEFERLLGFRGG